MSTDVKEVAGELLKTFSELFLLNCGCVLLDEIKEKVQKERGEGPKEAKWRLTKKKGGSKRKDELYRGELWMRIGEGAGDFSKWKKAYVVEEESYYITVYDNEKNFKEKKKPIAIIQPAGYELITDVKGHYKTDLEKTVKDIRDVDAEDLTNDMEPFTWALAHPNRTNYMFLARPNKIKEKSMISSLCQCGKKVEQGPVGEESEEEKELRERASDFMKTCIECAQPREKKTIEGKAFDLTIGQLPQDLEQLADDWKDDGTETEILVDLLMELCLEDTRNKIFSQPGPLSMKLKTWYKARKSTYSMLMESVEKAWNAALAGFVKLRTTLEPTLRTGLEPIVAFKMTIEAKVNGAVIDKLGTLLAENITPFVKPLMELYETPLRESLKAGRKFLEEKLNPENLSEDSKEREDYLKSLLDGGEGRENVYKSLEEMGSALKNIQALNPHSNKTFQGARLSKLKSNVQQAVDEILDAAIYTYMIRLNPSAYRDVDNEGVTNVALERDVDDITKEKEAVVDPTKCFRQVLEDFDHDTQIVRSEFVKEAVHSLLLEGFHKLADPALKPIIDKINDKIPDNFEKFLSLNKILDDVINFIIWQPIEKMVEAAYPLPTD